MDCEELINVLVRHRSVSPKDGTAWFDQYKVSGGDIFNFLESKGAGTKAELLQIVAESLGAEVADVTKDSFGPDLLATIPEHVQRIYGCVPLLVSEELVRVCMVDPLDNVAREGLEKLLGKRVEVAIVDPEVVKEVLGIPRDAEAHREFRDAPRGPSQAGPSGQGKEGRVLASRGGATLRGPWLAGVAALAAASAALAAAYVGQRHSVKEGQRIREEISIARQDWESGISELNNAIASVSQEVSELRSLLEKAEVDGVGLDRLRVEVTKLEGRADALEERKNSPPASRPGLDQSQAVAPQKPTAAPSP